MKPEIDTLLEALADLSRPGASLEQVATWTRTGRSRPRFYLSVWLSRIWRRSKS